MARKRAPQSPEPLPANVSPFPQSRIKRHVAPVALSFPPHYALTDEQEIYISRVRESLRFVAAMADAAALDKTMQIDPTGLSCLVSLLADQLPTCDDMPYGRTPGEFL